MLYLLLVLLLLLLVVWLVHRRGQHQLPPGPRGLPFVGVAWRLDPAAPHKTLTQWADMYGDVYSMKMYGMDFVVLNSYSAIHDALVKRSNMFAGRPPAFRSDMLFGHGVLYSTFSKGWLLLKRLMIHVIKKYIRVEEDPGEGGTGDRLLPCLEQLDLAERFREPTDLRAILCEAVTSLLASAMYGRGVDDSTVAAMLKMSDEGSKFFTQSGPGMALDFFPWLRFSLLRGYYQQLVKVKQDMFRHVQNEMDKVMIYYEAGRQTCIMDVFLEHQSAERVDDMGLQLSQEDICVLNLDLMIPGAVTMLQTLTALFAVLVNRPEVQERIAAEMESEVGRGVRPGLVDRSRLHYTQAVIQEVLRYHSMNPLGMAHMTTEQVNMGQYTLPKGTGVFFNLWKLHHDPGFWYEPWEFIPERFLYESGEMLPTDHPRNKRVLPCGAGRRACPGEAMARNLLFLIVTSVLQRFHFLPESDVTRPQHDPRTYLCGINIWPKPYKVKVTRRKY